MLHCNLVRADVRPLLGQKACMGMHLIKALDSDDVSYPVTGVEAAKYTRRPGSTGCDGSCDRTNSVDIINGGCVKEERETEDLT